MVDRPRRRPLALVALYAAPAALWLALARWAVPPVIEAAYQGRSFEPLNRVFRSRQPHPIEHYLRLWDQAAWALVIAGALHLAFVLLARRLGAGRGFLAFAAAFLGVTLVSGPRHDYVADLEIWDVILRGGDPWWIQPASGIPLNAYGPLFNALAVPAAINPMLPKLGFAFVYLALAARLSRASGRTWAWVANPFAWVEVAYFGHWDILVALACVMAVHERTRGRDVASGAWLAAGILFKYLPVVILPFLAVEGRRFRWRLVAAATLATAAGLGLSWLAWGPSTFRPLAFGASRPSMLLSIFRFLRGAYSPLRLLGGPADVDALATPCLALGGLAAFAWWWVYRGGPAAGATMGVLVTLLFYRVGFPQYQIVLMILGAYWIAGDRGRLAGAMMAVFFGWLGLFDVVYAGAGGVLHPGDPLAWIEEVVGLPTFVLGMALLVAIARQVRRR